MNDEASADLLVVVETQQQWENSVKTRFDDCC